MKLNAYVRRELLEISWLIIYVGIVVGIFSLFFGFGAGGFERSEILAKNNFYIPYGIIFLLVIVAEKVIGMIMFGRKGYAHDGALIHDPEQSPLGGFKVFNRPILLVSISVIVFFALGWFASTQNTFFSDIPKYEQQFTVGADLFFSVYPAAPSETLGAIALIGLVGLVLGWFTYKGKINPFVFFALFLILSTIVSMSYGIINHYARYGDSEVAITNVAFFWALGGFLTALTGSAIPFLIMHDVNNFFYRLSKLFASDIVNFIAGIVLAIMVVLFIILFIRLKNKPTMPKG